MTTGNGDSPRFTAPGFGHYAAEFQRLKQIKWSKSTRRAYRSILALYAEFTQDRWPVEAADVIGFLGDLQERQCSQATLDNYYRHIASFLRFAYKIEWLDHDPTEQIKMLGLEPDEPTDEPKGYVDSELGKVIRHLRTVIKDGSAYRRALARRDLAIILLAYTTGARANEIVQLKIGDFNFAECTVRIRNATAKGGGGGDVAFDLGTRDALYAWLDEKPKGKTSRFFVTLGGPRQWGKPLTGHGLQQMLLRRCAEADVPYRNFHALRHSAAYAALESGLSLAAVQSQMRHKDPRVTLRYAKRQPKEVLGAITKKNLSSRIDPPADDDDSEV